ncbi:MAG: carboxypeptidase regulatory-like domain-containing protein [Acidobacteriaceae bacterium]
MRSRLRTQRSSFLAGLLMGLLLFMSSWSFAQLSTSSLHGVVKDTQGSVVPNAALVLRNVDTSVENTTVSSGSGAYEFLDITPGRYTIEAKAAGFAAAQVPTFTLTVGQQASIDFSLNVGSQASAVTVQGAAPQLQTSSANLGTVIGTQQVNDLPLNGRNFTQLLLLTPGASATNVSQNGTFGPGYQFTPIALGSSYSFPAINGQTNRSNFYLTDGLTNNVTFMSTYAVPPIVDAIQEFKVVSHTDSAEFGSVLGGVVNVVTKSGTNDLHGSAWEYARNAIFDARTYFLPKTAAKADFSQNQFGGSVGGPAWIPKLYNGKNKTFFFGAYQGFRYTQTSNSPLKVPTPAQLAGDESDWPTQIYNPFSTRPDPANPGQYIRDPFPGNQIPAGLIDPLMVAWATDLFPAAGPVFDSNGDNAVDTTPITMSQNEWTARMDRKLGANDSAWFRYSYNKATLTSSGGLPVAKTITPTEATNWGGSYTHVFNPSTVVQVQFARSAANQYSNTAVSPSLRAKIISEVGFSPNIAGNGLAVNGGAYLPILGINTYSGSGDNYEDYPNVSNNSQYSGSLNKLIGRHSLEMGGGYTTMGNAQLDSFSIIGFAGAQTADTNPLDTADVGDPMSSFVLGVPANVYLFNLSSMERPGGVFSAFVQDSWRASTNLTLNYGLRYDLTFIPGVGTSARIGVNGGPETGDMDFNNGTYILAKEPPACSVRGFAPCMPGDGSLPAHVVVSPNGSIAHNTYTNFGPRVGFAYKVGDKTVVRGAFGIVYDNWAAETQMAQNLAGAWPGVGAQQNNSLNLPSTASATPTATVQDPLAGSGSSLFPAATPFSQVSYFYDPHLKNPYSDQWNLGVQRVLNPSTSVTVDYVGSVSKRLDIGGYYNTALTPGPGDPQPRALYPYIAATHYDRSVGHSNYNALQVSLDKRFVNGFAYQVAYTWSKAMDVASDGWFGVEGSAGITVPQDPYHPSAYGSYSVAGFDLTNILAVSTIYQVPVGRGRSFSTGNRIADYILGNWQENNIFSAHSGQPFTPYISSDIANTGNANYEHANLVGDPHLAKRTAAEWFNTAAYAVPPGYTFGTAGRDSLRSAPYWDLDASLFRQFPIGGDRRLELRAEAFNLLNNVVLGLPANDLNAGAYFGTINSTANTARELQLAAKFIF